MIPNLFIYIGFLNGYNYSCWYGRDRYAQDVKHFVGYRSNINIKRKMENTEDTREFVAREFL